MDPAAPIAIFTRKLQATFGDRALEVAQAQRDDAMDASARAEWARIVELLTHGPSTHATDVDIAAQTGWMAGRDVNQPPS